MWPLQAKICQWTKKIKDDVVYGWGRQKIQKPFECFYLFWSCCVLDKFLMLIFYWRANNQSNCTVYYSMFVGKQSSVKCLGLTAGDSFSPYPLPLLAASSPLLPNFLLAPDVFLCLPTFLLACLISTWRRRGEEMADTQAITLLQDNLSLNSCIMQTFVWMATWWNVGWFLSHTETSWKIKIEYQFSEELCKNALWDSWLMFTY